jgi:hypothetical protein
MAKRRPTTLGFSAREHEDKFQIAADFCKEYGKRFTDNIGEGKCDLALRNLNRHANVVGQSLVHLNALRDEDAFFRKGDIIMPGQERSVERLRAAVARSVKMQRKMDNAHAAYMATFEEDCT